MQGVLWFLGLLATAAVDNGDAVAAPHARPLIVIAAPAYRAALQPWIELRQLQGLRVQLIDPVELYRAWESARAVESLRDEIARRLRAGSDESENPAAEAGPAGFVLIVGDAPGPREPLDLQRLVPAAIQVEKARTGRPREFASDNVFGLPDERGVPRLAVGRWPVRSPEEVAEQVRKSLRYETEQVPGPHRRSITFLATTPNYDPVVDVLLERMAISIINAQVKPQWGLRALYSSPRSEFFPGPDQAARQVVRWLEDATLMTLFAGHGYDCGVDIVRYDERAYPVLDTAIAGTVCGERPGTVLWMSACSCGDFDLPHGRRGLAESLMMNPRGPTAVIAGSDETSAYSNLLLCLGLARDVIEHPTETLGEACVRVKRALYRPGPPLLKKLLLSMEPAEHPDRLPEDHQYLYNLLGDPTLRLRLPTKVGFSAEVVEAPSEGPGEKRFTVSGKLDDWDTGTVRVWLTLDRLATKGRMPDPETLDDAAQRGPAYLERFRRANDKVVAEAEAPLRDGRFELQLAVPESLAPRVRWLQVYVHTDSDPDGSWLDGVAAQAVKLATENVEALSVER